MTSPALDGMLVGWVSFMEGKNVRLNRKVLTKKAREIQKNVGGSALQFNLPIRWLTRFLKRADMRFRLKRGRQCRLILKLCVMGGGGGGAELNDLVSLYDPSDALNMDKAGLCYNRAPVGDICTRKKPVVNRPTRRLLWRLC